MQSTFQTFILWDHVITWSWGSCFQYAVNQLLKNSEKRNGSHLLFYLAVMYIKACLINVTISWFVVKSINKKDRLIFSPRQLTRYNGYWVPALQYTSLMYTIGQKTFERHSIVRIFITYSGFRLLYHMSIFTNLVQKLIVELRSRLTKGQVPCDV